MDLRGLRNRIAALAANTKIGSRLPSVITYRLMDGPPSAEDIARRHGTEGAFVLLPVFQDAEAWEAAARESQRKLKDAVRL